MLRYLAEHYLFSGVQGPYIYPRSGKLVYVPGMSGARCLRDQQEKYMNIFFVLNVTIRKQVF
jgi:hypothetical protein